MRPAHVHGAVVKGGQVTLVNRLDKSGQAVFLAIPPGATPHMEDDPQMKKMPNGKWRLIDPLDAESIGD